MISLDLVPAWMKLAAIGVAVAAASVAGWTANGWRLTSEFESERLTAAQGARDALAARTHERDALNARLRLADDRHASDLRREQNENLRLRDAVAAGSRRLFVGAKCPVAGLPETRATSGLDHGTGAELDDDARRAYFRHRDAVTLAGRKLTACQAELRSRSE